ncbi:MAG TPA: DoxX family protein [Cyclobacteriaceae bacterium]|nr:DoxX family protein [Cyclobacteriaceae bacterium]
MKKVISIVLRLIAAFIMIQTLWFKFTGAEESVYIFSQVGIEPWGRIGTGVAELIAAVLLLIPRTIIFGALMAIGIMLGAIVTHLFILGIEVKGDGGQLFAYALIVLVASVILVFLHFDQVQQIKKSRV